MELPPVAVAAAVPAEVAASPAAPVRPRISSAARAAKESPRIPKKILLVISAHAKEVELVVRGHRLIDLLHLIVRHLAVAGLRSLNDCTEARVSSRPRGYGSRRSSWVKFRVTT
jgi:hypothetical protein